MTKESEENQVAEDVAAEDLAEDSKVDAPAEDVEEAPSELDQIKAELAETQATLKEETDKRYRAYAELENFRKRKEQESQSFQKYAAEKVVSEVLPIVDSIELALSQTTETEGNKDVLEGFKLIQKQFQGALDKLNVVKIEAAGVAFDPNFHQAMSQEESEESESGTVVRVMQEGYQLHDRVIRPSLVVVAA